MTRVGILLLVLAAAAAAHDCGFCNATLVEAARNPEPWLTLYSCPDCGAAVKVYTDGTQSHALFRDGAKLMLIVDPHALLRPAHPIEPPAHPVERPGHPVERPGQAVQRPNHPVSVPGHAVSRPTHAVRRPTHAVVRPGHAIARPGQAILRPGHAVSRPGHPLGGVSRGIPGPMYAKVSVRAQPYAGRAAPRSYAAPYRR